MFNVTYSSNLENLKFFNHIQSITRPSSHLTCLPQPWFLWRCWTTPQRSWHKSRWCKTRSPHCRHSWCNLGNNWCINCPSGSHQRTPCMCRSWDESRSLSDLMMEWEPAIKRHTLYGTGTWRHYRTLLFFIQSKVHVFTLHSKRWLVTVKMQTQY